MILYKQQIASKTTITINVLNVLNINLFPSKHFYNLAHFVSLPHYAVFLDLYLDGMHQE